MFFVPFAVKSADCAVQRIHEPRMDTNCCFIRRLRRWAFFRFIRRVTGSTSTGGGGAELPGRDQPQKVEQPLELFFECSQDCYDGNHFRAPLKNSFRKLTKKFLVDTRRQKLKRSLSYALLPPSCIRKNHQELRNSSSTCSLNDTSCYTSKISSENNGESLQNRQLS